jgi:hypothetical protein
VIPGVDSLQLARLALSEMVAISLTSSSSSRKPSRLKSRRNFWQGRQKLTRQAALCKTLTSRAAYALEVMTTLDVTMAEEIGFIVALISKMKVSKRKECSDAV